VPKEAHIDRDRSRPRDVSAAGDLRVDLDLAGTVRTPAERRARELVGGRERIQPPGAPAQRTLIDGRLLDERLVVRLLRPEGEEAGLDGSPRSRLAVSKRRERGE
jgi:hypothetical protein